MGCGTPMANGRKRTYQNPISGAGVGVDISGGPVVDPTKNVLDLVKAEGKYTDAMRHAAEGKAEALAKAEQTRINDLAALRLVYDQRIAEDLRVNVKTTSDQLAGQLVKETGSLSQQIGALTTSFSNQITTLTAAFTNQISALTNALTPRIADLERFRWEQGGKTSVSDPATSEALTKMAKAIENLTTSKDLTSGHTKGVADSWGWIVAGIASAAALYEILSKTGH